MIADLDPKSGREWITWTRPKLKKFKQSFALAKKFGGETFKFEGHEFLVGYAYYLIEHLEQQFGTDKK